MIRSPVERVSGRPRDEVPQATVAHRSGSHADAAVDHARSDPSNVLSRRSTTPAGFRSSTA
ncbi:hypothetical protein RHRU231_660002 [Rhodococcus ruber]|uniref:Uncharacterized protein n=1 Tax=Rhodococcus ruber TaxID=1830 RepID=A0A098BR07_9NOCA|nr:hypothetical protein RHRU231_660002 [Rhodococcus ruber]